MLVVPARSLVLVAVVRLLVAGADVGDERRPRLLDIDREVDARSAWPALNLSLALRRSRSCWLLTRLLAPAAAALAASVAARLRWRWLLVCLGSPSSRWSRRLGRRLLVLPTATG